VSFEIKAEQKLSKTSALAIVLGPAGYYLQCAMALLRASPCAQMSKDREITLEQFTIGSFDPHDWFQRLKKAGGSVRVDKYHFGESVDFPPSRECEVIWDEIKGEENRDKAEAAYAYVRAIAEPFESWATV
jgi:hypothetical protein